MSARTENKSWKGAVCFSFTTNKCTFKIYAILYSLSINGDGQNTPPSKHLNLGPQIQFSSTFCRYYWLRFKNTSAIPALQLKKSFKQWLTVILTGAKPPSVLKAKQEHDLTPWKKIHKETCILGYSPHLILKA